MAKMTENEKAAAFERARKIVEEMQPVLESKPPADKGMALQLQLVLIGMEMGWKPAQLIGMLSVNVPMLYEAVEKAVADVAVGYKGKPNDS